MKAIPAKVVGVDTTGNRWHAELFITVLDAAEPPSSVKLSSSTIAEGAKANTIIGELKCNDPENGELSSTTAKKCTYKIADGYGESFAIIANTTGSWLAATTVFDYETLKATESNVQTVKVFATDPDGTTTKEAMDVEITVTDSNEKPTNVRMEKLGTHAEVEGTTVLKVHENTPPGTQLALLKADDPDTEKEGEPSCQITKDAVDPVDGQRLFDARDNKLSLKRGRFLNFETMREPLLVTIVCVDRPIAGGGTPMRSTPLVVEIQVVDDNDAPTDLVFIQDDPIPTEGAMAAVGTVIGTVKATDEDQNAKAFTMQARDASLYTLSSPAKCAMTGAFMTCEAQLTLNRALSAADPTCQTPNADGKVMCDAEMVLVDGEDASSVRVSSVQVALKDVWSAPDSTDTVSISIDEIVAGKYADNEEVATVEVVDADGKLGEFGKLGHSVTMTSAPDALGLKGSRRRRNADGTFEWKLVMKSGGSGVLDGVAPNDNVKLRSP